MQLPEDLEDLARWAVSRPWWRWGTGMRALIRSDVPGGFAGMRLVMDGAGCVHDHDYRVRTFYPQHAIPDLSDPATLGVLLGQLREATGDPGTYIMCEAPGVWYAVCPANGAWEGGFGPPCPTEAHAIIAALESMP